MKLQWELLIFYLALNLTFGLVIALGVPGTEYVNPAGPGTNITQYESHFNATDLAQSWEQSPFTGIPIVGDIYAGFNFFWQNFKFLVDGFPMLLDYVGNTYITDPDGQASFAIICVVLRVINAVLIVAFLIEFLSGRIFSD